MLQGETLRDLMRREVGLGVYLEELDQEGGWVRVIP